MAYVETGQILPHATVDAWATAALSLGVDRTTTPSAFTVDAATRELVGASVEAALRLTRPPKWITFVSLLPSGQIAGHADPPVAEGYTRVHVPVLVNDGCWSFHGGVWQQLTIGQVYTMDPSVVHGAVNWGATVRAHLLVDC